MKKIVCKMLNFKQMFLTNGLRLSNICLDTHTHTHTHICYPFFAEKQHVIFVINNCFDIRCSHICELSDVFFV